MTVSILRLLGVRPRERGEPGAQLRVGLGGPAPGQRAPRAVEQQSPSEPVVSGQQRGAPPRLERDLAGRSDVRYADVSQHFVEPLDGFLNRSTVHPRPRGADPRNSLVVRPRGADPRNSQLVVCCWQGSLSRGLAREGAGSLMAGKRRAIELACCAWTDLSQARIAAQVGWTQPYVGQIRAQLNTTIELPDHVVGVDGRRRPAKRFGAFVAFRRRVLVRRSLGLGCAPSRAFARCGLTPNKASGQPVDVDTRAVAEPGHPDRVRTAETPITSRP